MDTATDRRDPLERGLFRETAEGFTVFFPWGLTGRGYRLPDPAPKRTATRAVSLLMGAVLAVAGWTAQVLQRGLAAGAGADELTAALAAPAAALAAVVAGYALWAARFVEPFPPSDLVVPRDERLREAAAFAEPRELLGIGLVLAGLGGVVLALEPRAWWLGALAVAAGVGICRWARALRRAAVGAQPGRVAR